MNLENMMLSEKPDTKGTECVIPGGVGWGEEVGD